MRYYRKVKEEADELLLALGVFLVVGIVIVAMSVFY